MSDALREAAQAVLDRWDSPQWQWTKHGPTADLMHALRAALSAPAPAPAEAVAWLQSYTDQGHTYKRLFLVSEFPDMGGRQLAPGVTVVPLYAALAAPAVLREALAAERQRIAAMLTGIDKTETESDDGWWETSTGAAFGAEILSKVLADTAAPAGWQLVPKEATPEMCKAAVIFANGNAVYKNVAAEALKIEEAIYGEAYAAMIAAAPGAQGGCMTARIATSPLTGWQPIETAPKTGRKIVVAYVNRNGKTRTVMARWLTDEQAAETDSDGVGLEGGWYECIDNWDDYTEVAIHEGEPSHWMPLPAAPGAQGDAS